MKIMNMILCALLLLLVVGCNQSGSKTTGNTSVPGTNTPAITNAPSTNK